MNTHFFLSIIYLAISLVLGLLVTFITSRLFTRFIRRKYQITPNNTSFAFLLAAVIFSVGYIISGVLDPIYKMINVIRLIDTDTASMFFDVLKYGIVFIVIGYIVAFLIIILAMYLFNLINTEIDELEEISKDNVAVGILVGTIIIVITLFVKTSIIFFLENLIPHPELQLGI